MEACGAYSPFDAARHLIESIEGTLAMVIEDLVDKRRFELRGEEVFAAASTIKVPIMVSAFRRRDEGTLDFGSLVSIPKSQAAGGSGVVKELHDGVELSVLDLVTLMIIISDNTATNAVIDLVGLEAASRSAKESGAVSTLIRRKLVGAAFYARPDYSLDIDNTTSASDMVSIMKAIYHNKAAAPESCSQMLDILMRQQVNDRIPQMLPQGTRVAHKTGEFQTTRHDVGIVYPVQGKPYAISMLTKDLKDPVRAVRTMADISRVIHDWMTGA